MGHDIERCPVSKHLYTDIQRVEARDLDGSSGTRQKASGRPTVVVDADGAPAQIVVPASGRGRDSDSDVRADRER